MTKTRLALPSIALASLAFTGPALAHPGGHAGFDVTGFVSHVSTSAFHMALVLLALILGGGAVATLARRRLKRQRVRLQKQPRRSRL